MVRPKRRKHTNTRPVRETCFFITLPSLWPMFSLYRCSTLPSPSWSSCATTDQGVTISKMPFIPSSLLVFPRTLLLHLSLIGHYHWLDMMWMMTSSARGGSCPVTKDKLYTRLYLIRAVLKNGDIWL